MIATPMGKCAAALGFAGLLGTLLLLLLGLPATVVAQGSRATPTPATITATQAITGFTGGLRVNQLPATATVATGPRGRLSFSPNAEAAAGNFHLSLNGLPPAPAGQAYSLWLSAATTSPLTLGTFTVTAGQVDFTGSTAQDLPALYTTASIRLAAAAESSKDTSPTGAAILTATLPTTLAAALRPLLSLAVTTPVSTSNANTDKLTNGVLTAAQTQVAIAVKHTGFLRDALSTADIPMARAHSEHIVNILDGENGFLYNDLDRNGRLENPGDGVGVRVYLGAAAEAAATLSNTLTNTDALSVTTILPALEKSQSLIDGIFDKALQIFAADTVTEANGFAADLSGLVDQLNVQVNLAHSTALQLVTYPFNGPLRLPMTLTNSSALTIATSLTTAVAISTTQPPTAVPTRRALKPTATPTTTITATGHEHTLHPTATTTVTITATRRVTLAPTPRPSPTLAPTPLPPPPAPLPTVESSALRNPAPGQVWQDPTTGTSYVYVPGGSFLMGSTEAEAVSPREAPQHVVTVDPFWLGQTETTNAQYARCVAAEECTPPSNDRWADPTYADHPVSDLTWAQANAYAAWAGGRLPTEAEWERSCRSDDGRAYPWGNEEPDDSRSNYNNTIGETTAVGSYLAGQSAYGLLDLSGNLWEWTSSLETDYPYTATDGREDATSDDNRAVRGGSFYYTSYQIRCAARTGFAPTTANEHIGLRLVLDQPTVVYRNTTDGAVYIYVPGGSFLMGSSDAEAVSPREAPQHEVTVAGFWLGQTETTNAQYARCVAAQECTAPTNDRWDDPAYADYPVSDLTWMQANAYAAWAGGRLPTEAEWERACRSDDGRAYPWGNEEPDDSRSNYNNTIGETAPVGSYPAGQSAYGLLDLSGNLWEWTSSLEADYPYDATDGREAQESDDKRAVRGGSFYYTSYQIRCAARTGFAPTTGNEHIGLRLVLEPQPIAAAP